MTADAFHKLLKYCIAAIWLINGLFCKVLHMAPRHQQIVERILGIENLGLLTLAIGVAEIFMAIWIVSNFQSRLNALMQIIIIASMNTLEFILAPDLLLWGKGNALFAILLILVIFINEFYLKRKSFQQI